MVYMFHSENVCNHDNDEVEAYDLNNGNTSSCVKSYDSYVKHNLVAYIRSYKQTRNILDACIGEN